jgi:hypothetical protein
MDNNDVPYKLFLLIEYGDCWILQKSINDKDSGVIFELNNEIPTDQIMIDFFQFTFNQNLIFLDYWDIEKINDCDYVVFLGRMYDCDKKFENNYQMFKIEEIPSNPIIDQFAAKLITKNINKLRGVIR